MKYDIVIVGGGIVGATLACALAQHTSLSIALLEAQDQAYQPWSPDHYHHRVSAISLASQRIFQRLGVWNTIEKMRVSPFSQIQVWDASHKDAIQFDSQDMAQAALGFIIENNVIQTALYQKLQQLPQVHVFSSVLLTEMQETKQSIMLRTQDGREFVSQLAIAADGSHSWLREQAGFNVIQKDYEQQAIVATVNTSLAHQKIARQVFLATGPLAFLPLANAHSSSIVWSLPIAEANRLKSVAPEDFKLALSKAFPNHLGDIQEVGSRFCFPLIKQQASHYIKSRVILMGDAAHVVHPLAGQGVNMGLLDAASLMQVIGSSIKNRRQFADLATLRRYERWRKADNLKLLTGIDLIKNVFASDSSVIKQMRDIGLQTTNNGGWLKKMFIRHAIGERAGLPDLAK